MIYKKSTRCPVGKLIRQKCPIAKMIRQDMACAVGEGIEAFADVGGALFSDETIPMDGHQSRYGNLVSTADSLDGC